MASKGESPTTVASPQVLTPAAGSTVNKSLAPMPGSMQMPTISMNKEWVLPPKPKPGRKPAVDAPPTKRKAQNREAQRAFRERRAAKVGELEEQMKQMEEEDQKEQDQLKARIKQLENDVDDYAHLLMSWRERFAEMQMACGRERQLRQSAENEIEMLRKGIAVGTEAVALPPRRSTKNEYLSEQAPTANVSTETQEIPMGCGRCSHDTRCQCIDEAFELNNIAGGESPAIKRKHSPSSTSNSKRLCQSQKSNANPDLEGSEIDFTAQFSSRRPPALTTSASTASSTPATAAPDPCGFCQDGTPCLCAELQSNEKPHRTVNLPELKSQLSVSIPPAKPRCTNNPGTCAQCMSNPTSMLFCKSLAATQSLPSHRAPPAPTPASTQTQAIKGPTLTCADTFTTLSRHPAFNQASTELGAWMPQLATVPTGAAGGQRTAFEIEAASVMGVLRLFDRRFGDKGTSENGYLDAGVVDQFEAERDLRDGHYVDRRFKHGNGSKTGTWINYEPGTEDGIETDTQWKTQER
ncbi:hypothetical protein MMC28_004312 [Mycoblastus sanguinarius]|nr:hypothetical protein [Mycoblastus sanguinarius]